MLTRRDFLQVALAATALTGMSGRLASAAARQTLSQDDLLRFKPVGQVTLLHLTDIHAQLVPLYFREPSSNLGVAEVRGLPPHLVGKAFLHHYGFTVGSREAYALTSEDFASLAKTYGRVGGLDRLATLIKAIRAQRPTNTLLLDGGDTWQGSYTSLETQGADMVEAMNALGCEAMTAHWEFTYGEARVQQLKDKLTGSFLAGNVFDNEWEEPVFAAISSFERGGVKIAVIGQAFPYTPVANPRYKIPNWSFGIREEAVRQHVATARRQGAQLVVLLSHNGFDVDRKLAGRVDGIDVMLTGHTHDALPQPVLVGKTLLIASGSHGKFLSRLDLEVGADGIKEYAYRLIPVFADVIAPDAEIAGLVKSLRAPYMPALTEILGHTDTLLYRRGNFNGTFDGLICQALLQERDAEIALSPGFRWGATLLPGQSIRLEDVYNQTAITYPNAYRLAMTGKQLKLILEDVADNLFHPDPYYQQGGDMVRVGGMGYSIKIGGKIGSRITDMTLLKTGRPIEPSRTYIVAGWASVREGTQGPPIYDVVARYIRRQKVVSVLENHTIKVVDR